jgi:hypothetical protein
MGVYLGFFSHHASSVPLVLSTSTGLVSPQFHVVFDDFFSTTKCLQINELPSSWSTLLQSSSYKLTDNDFNPEIFTDTSWFTNANSSSPSISNTSLSPFQREDEPSPGLQREQESISTSQREPVLQSTAPGWNPHHRYETRFKQQHMANVCSTNDNYDDDTIPFDMDLYSALIAVQNSYPIHSGHDISFLEHYACTAQTNPNVLHYGAMIKDKDCSLF